MTKIAFVFPGQGSQKVGMGKDFYDSFPDSKNLFDEINSFLEFSLTDIMFNGPSDELTKTFNTQPALLAVSTVILEQLTKNGINPDSVAGHSLGEYSALVAANSLSIKEAIKLVYTRGKLMSEAVPSGNGAMAAVLGLNFIEVEEVVNNFRSVGEVVCIANYNCPGQVVISGTKAGIDFIAPQLKEKGAKRVLMLPVSGPFHSPLMKSAADKFSEVVKQIEISDPVVPVYSNVTSMVFKSKMEISDLLADQIYSSVKWEQSITRMINDGITKFIEVGSGNVLTGLIKKIDPNVEAVSISTVDDLRKFIEENRG
ncbi:MAG: malonyl CoA-acyl carrier protein transacylase [Bacillales bacterium]|jgi:[acyl-carrier-protein] S-malonyltransferase|nr:malonyl CoA-acyl carrier protein transacylase [Bacillales bacterium]